MDLSSGYNRRRTGRALCVYLSLLLVLLQGCSDSNWQAFSNLQHQPVMLDVVSRDYDSSEPLRPLPEVADLVYSPSMVQLGNRLYHDTRLSGDRSVSCASCHDIAAGGDDGLQFSVGINKSVGGINAPTVLNSSFNFVQFWNGRAEDLQVQAAGPVANPIEMGADWDEVIAQLTDAGDYDQAFVDAFGDKKITEARVTRAIADFESVLITPSPFDRYLRGDKTAISANAATGYRLFKQHGCSSCHQGINVGGNLFQKFGALERYYKIETDADKGRLMVTNNENHMSVFKVPSLRNVAITAPYFHTGSVTELETAVRIMGFAQLGRSLSDEDIGYIATFLRTLTGEKNHLQDIEIALSGDDR